MADDERFNAVPTWNGDPSEWERYRDEVRVYCLGTKLSDEYSIAARLVQRLKGAARRIGLGMTDDELSSDPPPTRQDSSGNTVVGAMTRTQYLAGVQRLMTKLQVLAPAGAVRRGGYMKSFFSLREYRRKQGERMASWVTRWEDGLEKLRRDDIDVDALGDLGGWWFLEEDANLSEERIEMVKTHMGSGNGYDRTLLREVLVRLFPNIHMVEQRRHQVRFQDARTAWRRQGAVPQRGRDGKYQRYGRQVNHVE